MYLILCDVQKTFSIHVEFASFDVFTQYVSYGTISPYRKKGKYEQSAKSHNDVTKYHSFGLQPKLFCKRLFFLTKGIA